MPPTIVDEDDDGLITFARNGLAAGALAVLGGGAFHFASDARERCIHSRREP